MGKRTTEAGPIPHLERTTSSFSLYILCSRGPCSLPSQMSYNRVDSMDDVNYLRAVVPHITALYLNANPVARSAQYRNVVLSTVTSLNELDGIDVVPGANPLLGTAAASCSVKDEAE